MKNTLIIEYNSVSKRHEVFNDHCNVIGRVYANHGVYDVYLRNEFIGKTKNPYSAKQLIFDTLYPDEKQKREERKQECEAIRKQKEKEKQEVAQKAKIEHDAVIAKMNEIRDNKLFRQFFCSAAKVIFSELKNETDEEICARGRIMMNGIALYIVGGQDEINKAIKRNDNEGKILKSMINSGILSSV